MVLIKRIKDSEMDLKINISRTVDKLCDSHIYENM